MAAFAGEIQRRVGIHSYFERSSRRVYPRPYQPVQTQYAGPLGGKCKRPRAIPESHGIPAGRFGKSDDIKGLALWLASDASAWITGAIIPMDGGNLAMNAGGGYIGQPTKHNLKV